MVVAAVAVVIVAVMVAAVAVVAVFVVVAAVTVVVVVMAVIVDCLAGNIAKHPYEMAASLVVAGVYAESCV